MREEEFDLHEDDFVRLRAALLDRRGIADPTYDQERALQSATRHFERAARFMARAGRPAEVVDGRLRTPWKSESGAVFQHEAQVRLTPGAPRVVAQRLGDQGVAETLVVPIHFDLLVGDWVGPLVKAQRFEDPAVTLIVNLLRLAVPKDEDGTEF